MTKMSNFFVSKFKDPHPSAAAYIGRELDFQKCPDLFLSTPGIRHGDMINYGAAFVHSVVFSTRGVSTELYFKFYQKYKHRNPPQSLSEYSYIPCRCVFKPANQITVIEVYKALGDTLFKNYMIGRRVLRKFIGKNGKRSFVGNVVTYDAEFNLYRVNYNDTDWCEMSLSELNNALIGQKYLK